MTALRRLAVPAALLLIVLGFALARPDTFLTARNLLNVSQQVAMLAVVAFAMTAVMAQGDFDLSVGSMASLAGVVAATLWAAGWSLGAGLAAALAAGLLGGLLNGLLVAALGILPFVATLGTLTMFSGAAFLVSDGRTIFGADIPEAVGLFARGGLALGPVTVPSLTLVALAALLLVWLALGHTSWGRRLHAVGGNVEAARLAGLPVRRLRLSAFLVTGLGAAVAGLMLVSRVESANPTQGAGLMLDAIAAVFLGMTASEEAEPSAGGTLMGVALLAVLDNGLTQLSVDSYLREVLVGAIILAAVGSARVGLSRA